ncbi:MAG: NlpC/P60 family protein [Bacteroidales bacterium]
MPFARRIYSPSSIVITLFIALLLSSCGSSKTATNYNIDCKNKRLERTIESWLGTPYKYGGLTKDGVDCSGFVNQVYKSVYRKNLERSTYDILDKDCRKIKFKRLKEGDLVFFATSTSKKANHVGIYLYDDKFVHASSSSGVIVSSLTNEYYVRNFKTAARVK